MPWLPAHPHKHLIRDLWPDKHLYATTLLLIGAFIGAGFALVARVVPVSFAPDMPTAISGWNWPFGIILPAIVAVLAILAYRARKPWIGFVAAGIQFVSAGALGIVPLMAIAASVFLFLARREGEHVNPRTKALHPHLWPDKALVAALLFVVAGVASVVWGGMLLSGWLGVRSLDVTVWGWVSLLVGAVALVGAQFAYWQRSLWVCVVAATLVGATFGLVVVGPGLAIALGWFLSRAHLEGEFKAMSPGRG